MEGVPKFATSVARIDAVNFVALVKVVARGLPFHSTSEHVTNPVPFTVSVNPNAPAGSELSGTKGWLICGTGAAATDNMSACIPKLPTESVTFAVKVKPPGAHGVPESTPEAGLSEMPGGSEPELG